MKRRLFTILCILSLLLFVAVVVLWVRSYVVGDVFIWHSFEDNAHSTLWVQDYVMIGRGGVGFLRVVEAGPKATWRDEIEDVTKRNPIPFHQRSAAHYPTFEFAPITATKGRAGFKWGYSKYQTRPGFWGWSCQIIVPFWALLLLALPPVAVLTWWRVKRRRAEQRGLCPSCGYDLCATPDRCPECGTAATAARTS